MPAEVTCHYEARGQRVEGVGLWGAWDHELWAEFPDGRRARLWEAGPPHHTSSKCVAPHVQRYATS